MFISLHKLCLMKVIQAIFSHILWKSQIRLRLAFNVALDGKKKINGHWELDYGDFFFHFRDTKSLDVLSLLSSIIDFQCTFSHLQCSAEMGKQHKMTLLCSDGNRVPRRDSRNSHTSTKGGLISEGISLRLKSPNNGAKS